MLKLTHVGSSYFISDQANANSRLAAYTVWDVVANYHYDAMDFFIRVDNVTGVKYASYGAYTSLYPAATAQVRAGASYQF